MSAVLFLESHTIPYLQIFVRVAGIFVLTPVFSISEMPMTAKGFLAGGLSLVIYPIVAGHLAPAAGLDLPLLLVLVDHALIGVLIGFFILVYYTAFLMAGEFYSLKMGFGIINVIDPMSQTSIPILGQFKSLFALIIFISTNAHHLVIEALVYSFRVVPVMALEAGRPLTGALLTAMNEMFVISFQLAAPIIGTVMVIEVVMGIMSKVAPQMNVMVVGFQIKIVIGLVVLMAFMPQALRISERIFDRSFIIIHQVLGAIAK
jgi:flagellar biosynthetic protein FliR